jgi:hypothetical protein
MPDEELHRLWIAPEEDLLASLGASLLGEGIGFGIEDPLHKRRFAEAWLIARRDRIRDQVCSDPVVRAILEAEPAQRLLEAATVADALTQLAGRPALSVLTVIVLRRGAQRICGTAT